MWRSIRYSIDIHYSWAGPPNAQDRDINGPISIRSKVSNGLTTTYQMYFWCLDAHVAAFKRKFQLRGIKNTTTSRTATSAAWLCSTVTTGSEWRGIHGARATENVFEGHHADVWALYAPRYDKRVLRSLYWYCRVWEHLEERRRAIRDERSLEEYKQASRHAVMDALYTGLSHTDKGLCRAVEKSDFWDCGKSLADGLIPELGIQKKYYGSHR